MSNNPKPSAPSCTVCFPKWIGKRKCFLWLWKRRMTRSYSIERYRYHPRNIAQVWL